MRALDFSPLYRATVGFDRLFNALDAAQRSDESAYAYPPYNIEKTGDDTYRISMAVAGFTEDELDVTVKEGTLTISGKKEKTEGDEPKYLHRGVAFRSFERRFDLADHIQVSGAALENGLLHVELVREVPEAAKPKSIKIGTSAAPQAKVIDSQAA